MRYWIIPFILSILTLTSLPCHADAPIGYIGLFADYEYSTWCVAGEGYYFFEMWVWCLPSYDGQICAEFAISYPSNVIQSTITRNTPLLAVTLPDCIMCEGNMCMVGCCYVSCQWDWHWIFHQQLYVTDQTPSYCEIVAHPYAGTYQLANCLPGYPVEPCIKYTNLFINYDFSDPECTVTSAAEASWGAIKSLLK